MNKAATIALWFALISLIVFFVGIFAALGWKSGLIIFGVICFCIGSIAYSEHVKKGGD